jgi:hypothetical protein
MQLGLDAIATTGVDLFSFSNAAQRSYAVGNRPERIQSVG